MAKVFNNEGVNIFNTTSRDAVGEAAFVLPRATWHELIRRDNRLKDIEILFPDLQNNSFVEKQGYFYAVFSLTRAHRHLVIFDFHTLYSNIDWST